MTHSADQNSPFADPREFADTGDKAEPKKVAKKNLSSKAKTMVANARNDITIPFFSNVLQPTDDTLVKKGGSKGLAIYDEIERDTHASSVLQKRKKTLVAREWEVTPGGEDQIDLDAAEFIKERLETMPFDRICEDLLDATLKGYAVSEVVWKRDGNHIVPGKVKSHDQRRFVFDADWNPRLLTKENMQDGIELPDRKFIVHRYGVKGNNAYGLGLGSKLFWATLFKREGVAFWLTFLDKFAAPTVVGKTPYGLGEKEESKLLQSLASMVKESAILVPTGVDVDLLEAARTGSVSYKEWCEYWDNQISICVNGETLTTDIQGNGSRAASEVHASMLEMLVDADGDLLKDTLQETLFQWLVDYNYPGAKVPTVKRVRPANAQAEAATREKRAKAAKADDEALKQVVATSALFEADDEAREYIQMMAPYEIDADRLDMLVANRAAFAASAKPDPKKKDLTPEPDEPAGRADTDDDDDDARSTAGFADAADPDADIQNTLIDHLERFGEDWDARRLGDLEALLSAAASLEDAAKAALKLAVEWKPDEFAETIELALNASTYAGRDAVLSEMAGDVSFAEPQVFNQPFKEQIDFFKQKAPRPTSKWTDVMHGDHDRAFVIAGAKDRDMLADFQDAIQKAITEGTPLEDFRKDFDQIVAKYGWTYKGERGWRTRVIFDTNVRTSYMAGRLKQMRDPAVLKARPYWQYRHGQTRKPKVPRPQHRSWDGLILRHDDTFWEEHFPPNGWVCSCGVRTLSKRDLKRLGKDGPDHSPQRRMKTVYDPKAGGIVDRPAGLERGFEYQPGHLWEQGLVPSEIGKRAGTALVPVDQAGSLSRLAAKSRPFKAKKMPARKRDTFYTDAFLKGLDGRSGRAELYRDKVGMPVVVSEQMFAQAGGKVGFKDASLKLHAAQLAETIADPDEIWIGVERLKIPAAQGGGSELVLTRKYLRTDPATGLLILFELAKGGWSARIAHRPTNAKSAKSDVAAIDKRRTGLLAHQRPVGDDDE